MCLYLFDENCSLGGKRIAGYHGLVWKCLMPLNGKYQSPYQNTPYVFGKLYTSLLVEHYKNIGPGLHSWRFKQQAIEDWDDTSWVFPAIIPKGSHFYYGNEGDIVSNQLIVYKSMKNIPKKYSQQNIKNPGQHHHKRIK